MRTQADGWSVLVRTTPAGQVLLGDLLQRGLLSDADVVAERVAQRTVDPVGLLGGLLGELHTLGEELVVGRLTIVCGQDGSRTHGPLGDQVAHRGCSPLRKPRRCRDLQQDVPVGLAGRGHGEPAHEAHLDVGGHLEAEVADVEVERGLLVEDVDAVDAESGDHVVNARRAHSSAAYPILLGRRVHALTKQTGTSTGWVSRRYCLGLRPTIAVNVRLKVPRLAKPTASATSVTGSVVSRSRAQARSTRRRCRCRCGVSPNRARNRRLKCAGDMYASAATAGTSIGCA